MNNEFFKRLILQLKVGCGSYPALTGHHITQDQYDEIHVILQKRKENINRYINALKSRIIEK